MFPVFVCRAGSLMLISLLLTTDVSATEKPILLRNPFSTNAPAATISLQRNVPSVANGLFVIQFRSTLQPEWRTQLNQLSVTLLRYIPEDAFVAKLRGTQLSAIRALDFVQFVGEYRADQKIHSRVRQALAATTKDNVEIAVVLSTAMTDPEAQQARTSFATLTHESKLSTGRILRGSVSQAQLNSLAGSDAVLWIEAAPKMQLYDEVSSRIVAGDGPGSQTLVQSLGYNGAGVTVAVADSGLDSGDTNSIHPDLAGRVKALLYYGTVGQLEDAADEHGHGTHCAGIIAGNGTVGEVDENNFRYGLGVAPGAGIIAQRIFDGAGGYAAPPSFETLTRDAKRAGADVASNSWGDDTQGQYDISAMEFDALVRDADALTLGDQPYIVEFSAGNAGPSYQTVGSPAVAKNVIATGATQNDRFNLPIEEFAIYADGRDAMADFSSRGPCADGRIKPDLVAPGSWIASLRSVYANDDFAWWPISDNYMYEGGTSQAGPHVSGAAAVFVQYWRTTHGGATPSPALVKAALINSATDVDDGFTTFEAVPNNDEGWGRVNLPALIGSTRNYDFTDQTTVLTNGGIFEKRILVGSSVEPLKITLAYTDVPGLPAAAIALVNDLDLEVIAPTGEVFRGNRFAGGESVPDAPTPDTINNVEAVQLTAPVPGEYVIRVRGTRIIEDARIDTPAVDQDFALVASGAFGTPGNGIVTFNRSVYRAPDLIKLTLVDYDLAGQPTVPLQLRSATEPLGEIYTLKANGNNGSFTGSVATAIGPASNDGKIQVAHGDLIEAVYHDAAPVAARSFSANADLSPPVISGLRSTNQFGQLSVLWNTDEDARGEIYYGISTPNTAVTNLIFDVSQEAALPNLPIDAVVKFFVVAQDRAGNRSTNNNSGNFYTVTNTQALAILLVDSYAENGFIEVPPLSGYTAALDAIGASFDIFDATSSQPTLAQLQEYRCVIWRMDEISAPSAALVQNVARYVTNGGSLLLTSMDAITRLGEAGAADFARNILQVQANVEDQPVNDILGATGDPVGAGINTTLDYLENYSDLMAFLELVGVSDPSDWLTPSTNAASVMLADGEIVGVRSPKTGVDLPGRVVFLSFPLDTVPLGSGIGNNRSGLLNNILNFLAPHANTSTVTLDSDVYSLPGRAVVEVEDTDLGGQGSLPITVRSPQHTNQLDLTLLETTRPGLFRGSVVFANTNNGAPGIYLLNPDDTVRVDYFDASAGKTNFVTAIIDTNAPIISSVFVDPGYLEAVVSWDTSKDADSLVQYGESPNNLPNNFVAYDALPTSTHELLINGLKPNTTYYLRVTSRDRAGNTITDDNGGDFYSFTTLQPLTVPWSDNLETNNSDWSVITSEDSESAWTRGPPSGGEQAHSGAYVWGSDLSGSAIGQMESYLVSPGILLTGGNKATLRFWHNYDFLAQGDFEFQLAAIEIITNLATAPVVLAQMPEDYSGGWEEMELDLTPYLGNVVYLVWYHFIFSFDAPPRLGWLVDDVSITTSTIVPGTIQITNNLWQTVFALAGPSGRTASGRSLLITNAAPGQYTIQYGDVPYYTTPPNQTNNLVAGGNIAFTGNYSFSDANTNGIPDTYEEEKFGALDFNRDKNTDTDRDGLSDWAEFVAGTDPMNPPPPFRLTAQRLPNNLIKLSWPSVTNHTYRVHASSNATVWTPQSAWFAATGTNTSFTIATTTNGPTKFFRVEALPPASSTAGTFKLTATVLPSKQIRLDWPSAPGHGYRILGSTNLSDWSAYTGWLRPNSYSANQTLPPKTNGAPNFFRLEAQP